MATVGQQLLTPESGWRRYDDTDSRINYVGVPAYINDSNCWNNTAHYTNSTEGSISFKFYGTKLRIIIGQSPVWSKNVKITIDNIDYIYSNYNASGLIVKILTFEKLDLSIGVHTIIIQNVSAGYWGVDCIDIDDTGYLVNPTPVISYLIEDGALLKTISNGNLTTVCNTTDSDTIIGNAFNTNGITDLSVWNDSLTNQITNSTFNIAMYKK